jgi:uncharacterized protein DUF397
MGITARAIHWQKSSFSSEDGSCVELAIVANTLKFRESDDPDVIATTTPPRLRALLLGVRTGAFDHMA